MPTMPNVIGQNLASAQTSLQTANVLIPNAIGYFGTWPISITWIQPTVTRPSLDGTAKPSYYIVTAQTPAANSAIAANGSVTLTVTSPFTGVAYP